jgi:ATP-dependent DNA helicase
MYHGTPDERAALRENVIPIPEDDDYTIKPESTGKAKGKRKARGGPEPSASEAPDYTTQKSNFPVVITTFEMIIRDRAYLSKYKWGFVVVDEGHRLKNMDSTLMREIKKYQSATRLVLTGTPLQVRASLIWPQVYLPGLKNNLSELWSLLNFILPDIFSDVSAFQDWYERDLCSTLQ